MKARVGGPGLKNSSDPYPLTHQTLPCVFRGPAPYINQMKKRGSRKSPTPHSYQPNTLHLHMLTHAN